MSSKLAAVEPEPLPAGFPQWTASTLNVTNGRDPLALETITANQIMPILLPGLVVLSRRARYLSYSLLLIDEFHRRGGSSQNELGRFVRRGEFDLLLAVRQCTNPRCGVNAPATVGYFAVSDSISKSDGSVYERGESVQGDLGGYGQQYRSLLIALDLVAERGLNYQGEPLKFDRITTKARPVVDAVQTAVAGTTWYRTYLGTEDPIPREAVLELSEAVCLCRLKSAEPERKLLHQALFGTPGAETLDQLMRIRGFALTLEGLGADARIESSDGPWRRYLWDRALESSGRTGSKADTAAGWGAMVAKEWYQQAVAAIWAALSEWGRSHQPQLGFPVAAIRQRIRIDLAAAGETLGVSYRPEEAASELSQHLVAAHAAHHLEDVQADVVSPPWKAMDGLSLLLLLASRLPNQMPPSWESIGRQRSSFQPGVLTMCGWLRSQLDRGVSVAELLEAVTVDRVLVAHDRVASDRLPNYIFRWRFEEGRWRFLTRLSMEPFSLGGSRHEALIRLSEDLGLWEAVDGAARLTERGRQLVEFAWR